MTHNHSTTSNTDEVYRTFIGCRVKGLVREITHNGHHADVLVFECGWGLAINSNGTHWTVNPEETKKQVRCAMEELDNTKREIEHLLELAGEKIGQ